MFKNLFLLKNIQNLNTQLGNLSKMPTNLHPIRNLFFNKINLTISRDTLNRLYNQNKHKIYTKNKYLHYYYCNENKSITKNIQYYDGTSYLFYKKRPIIIESNVSNQYFNREIFDDIDLTIYYQNWYKRYIEDFIEKYLIIDLKHNSSIYVFDKFNRNWNIYSKFNPITMNDIYLTDENKNSIQKLIHLFENKKYFKNNNINTKLSLMLYGDPGNGKSMIIRGIASKLQTNIYYLTINLLLDEYCYLYIKSIPHGALIVIEDFDEILKCQSLDISMLRNLLDGIVSLYDHFLILTTNNFNDIPEELKRYGRIDKLLYINYPTKDIALQYIKNMTKNDNQKQLINILNKIEFYEGDTSMAEIKSKLIVNDYLHP